MPKVTYSPAGGEPATYDFDIDDLYAGEIVDLEEASGKALGELAEGFVKGSFTSAAWLLWVLRRRDEPSFTVADMRQIRMSELDFEIEDEAPAEPQKASGKGKSSGRAAAGTGAAPDRSLRTA